MNKRKLAVFLGKKVLTISIMLFFAVFITFFLMRVTGDPAELIAGPLAKEADIERIRIEYGLDRPIYEQFVTYFTKVMTGDFGYSLKWGRPVFQVVTERLGTSLTLSLSAQVISLVFGVLLGTYSVKKRGKWQSETSSIISLVLYATPVFLIAMILMYVFGMYLRLFPISGAVSLRGDPSQGIFYVLDVLWHAVLPITALSCWYGAIFFRVTRASVSEVLNSNFMLVARSKGISENTLYFKHALRNAILPVIALAGLYMGSSFVGALMTETVFGWPGIGRLMYDSILARDANVTSTILILGSLSVIVASSIADLIIFLLDPRVRS
jgi:peptide/nickel transport system permease protein